MTKYDVRHVVTEETQIVKKIGFTISVITFTFLMFIVLLLFIYGVFGLPMPVSVLLAGCIALSFETYAFLTIEYPTHLKVEHLVFERKKR